MNVIQRGAVYSNIDIRLLKNTCPCPLFFVYPLPNPPPPAGGEGVFPGAIFLLMAG